MRKKISVTKKRKEKEQGEKGKLKIKNKGDKWIILLPRSPIYLVMFIQIKINLGAYFLKTLHNCERFFPGPTSNGHPGWNLIRNETGPWFPGPISPIQICLI
jgi:hypothetical protein